MDKKKQLLEFFLYIALVIAGTILLFMKADHDLISNQLSEENIVLDWIC
jgi:hypothetical protein